MSRSDAILKTLEVTMYRCELREKQRTVLWMLLQGKEKKEIASTLHLSEEAIRKHQRTIYNKLGIEGKSQLVKWVIEQISTSIHEPQPLSKDQIFWEQMQRSNQNEVGELRGNRF
ncbi:response regulator transcription factor [Paenibacillus amylolyticus]|uniref:response regulator transcription factor n=1 Tax=Paenibacillus amylolyticus TaxID=1451 RepID=UPI003392E1B4